MSFHSLRARLALGFCAMALLTGALGVYGVEALSANGTRLARAYDREASATDHAVAAQRAFLELDRERLRARVTTIRDLLAERVRLESLGTEFFEHLARAQAAAATREAQGAGDAVRHQVRQWIDWRDAAETDPPPTIGNAENRLDAGSFDIAQGLAGFVDMVARAGLRDRARAAQQAESTRATILAASLLALAAGAAIGLLLARSVLRPLMSAATVADRIAAGDLEAAIPPDGRDEGGALLRSLRGMRDSLLIRMADEAALRRAAENRLATALDGAGKAMVLVDAHDRVVIANGQAAGIFPDRADRLVPGAAFAGVFGRPAAAAPSANDDARLGKPSDASLDGGETRLTDGRWVRSSRSITADGEVFLFWSDITEHKTRERSLIEAMREAEAASLAKTQFLANISHELRTPLNAIIGFSEILSSELLGPLGSAQYLEYSADILSSGQHLLEVINDVLDLAKSEAGEAELRPDMIDLPRLVHACVRMVGEQCARGSLGLAHEIEPGLDAIWGDAPKLKRVLINLLSNAVKFTPPGGRVAVRVLADGEAAVLVVTDTGIGMRAEDIPVALAPFRQIDSALARRYEGTGLGLPLARHLAELHGGSLEIESTPGAGTAVTVRLPGAVTGFRAAAVA